MTSAGWGGRFRLFLWHLRLSWVVVWPVLVWPGLGLAQSVIPDGSLGGESSQVQSNNGSRLTIEGGAARGGNLFHSFDRFGVDAGQQVYFMSPIGIDHIFGRVTGRGISQIDGTLGVLGSADLFLLNPNGIVFGPGARLEISGSFTASTAAAWTFADGYSFSATDPPVGDLLTVNVPLGLQLNRAMQGTIVSQGQLSTGKDLTFSGSQLSLAGQLVAGRDLNLYSQGTVTVRDTSEKAFVARSGRNLTIQGNQEIDILALQHLDQMPFVSGGDLTLISDGVISGDAHFESGGDLRFLTLAGSPGKFVSFYDPIILADGDVVFGDYTGVALKVEATGSIEAGDIEITGPDTTFVADGSGSDEDLLASSRAVILRAGMDANAGSNLPQSVGGADFAIGSASAQPPGSITVGSITTYNGDGGDAGPIILKARGNITANDWLRAYADSGIGQAGNGGNVSIMSETGDITIDGWVSTYSLGYGAGVNAGNGGAIAISSQSGKITIDGFLETVSYANDNDADSGNAGSITVTSGSGDIQIVGVNAFSQSNEANSGNGGNISLISDSGDIDLEFGDLGTSSYALGTGGIAANSQAGNAGNIVIRTESGNIRIQTPLPASSLANDGNAGNGGNISVASGSGNIDISALRTVSNSELGDAGDGGQIVIASESGDILLRFFFSSYAFSAAGNTGNAGSISIVTNTGQIAGDPSLRTQGLQGLFSLAIAQSGGTTGSAGNITLVSPSISNLDLYTLATNGPSGDVQLRSDWDNLSLDRIRLTTSGQVSVPDPSSFGRSISLNLDDFGQSGNTLISSPGNITLNNVQVQSSSNGSQVAGDIRIISPSQVTFNQSQLNSNANQSGDAGQIEISANRVVLGQGSRLFAATSGSGRGGTIQLQATESVQLGQGVQDAAPIISVEASGSGAPGDIRIQSPQFILSETARITATATETATNPSQRGSIFLESDRMDLAGVVGIFAETAGQSPGGVLTLKPYQSNPSLDLTLAPGAQVSASTFSSGAGGNLIITAPESIRISGPGLLSSETSGSGAGGNIQIATSKLDISGGTRISTTAKLPQPKVVETITVEDFFDVIDIDAGGAIADAGVTQFTFSVPKVGNSVADLELRFSAAHTWNSDLVVSLTSPQGTGSRLFGNVGDDGDNFQDTLLDDAATTPIDNGAAPFTGSFSVEGGDGFEVFKDENPLGTWTLTVTDTFIGDSGYLFHPNDIAPWGTALGTQLLLHTQTKITTSTVVPVPPPIPTAVNPNLGRGGTITIAADTFNLNNASLLAETEGFTRGGDINIKTNQLNLNNGNITVRSTGSGDSGNINIESGQSIILGRNSVIETDAGGSGNGGNISINTPFLISFPGENNDIIANAIGGNGGQIKITAQNLFNFEQKDGQNRSQLRSNRINDISASSETGIDGIINLDAPNVNPANNLAQLSTDLVDGDNLIERTLCAAGNQSKFLITGRGGLPTAPTDTLSVLPLWDSQDPGEIASAERPEKVPSVPSHEQIEAQNWMLTPEGKFILYADLPISMQTQLLQELAQRSPHCRQPQEVLNRG